MLQYFTEKEASLKASFSFSNFRVAFAFMTEVAFVAEKMGHHPNWSNVYNQVDIELSTHDAGDVVTELDHKLASKIEEIVAKYLK
jgi:4a-hydroxytetrahydrobiopterin dehydratase